MKYKINNDISKRGVKKQGKNILPLMKFTTKQIIEEYINNTKEITIPETYYMVGNETKRPKSRPRNIQKNPFNSEII